MSRGGGFCPPPPALLGLRFGIMNVLRFAHVTLDTPTGCSQMNIGISATCMYSFQCIQFCWAEMAVLSETHLTNGFQSFHTIIQHKLLAYSLSSHMFVIFLSVRLLILAWQGRWIYMYYGSLWATVLHVIHGGWASRVFFLFLSLVNSFIFLGLAFLNFLYVFLYRNMHYLMHLLVCSLFISSLIHFTKLLSRALSQWIKRWLSFVLEVKQVICCATNHGG